MLIKIVIFLFDKIYTFIASDLVANCISFYSLLIAVIALFVGGINVSKVLMEYKKSKRKAVFGYHINLKIFVIRLKHLVSDNRSKPMGSLYLFSSNQDLRNKGKGYEVLGEELVNLAREFLDYLSTESNQIPASVQEYDFMEWDSLIEELVEFLTDFLLYNTQSYSPEFDDEKKIYEYHNRLMNVLSQILNLIENVKIDYMNKIEREIKINK